VTEVVALAAALVAWAGVTLVLVADGRRGLALGLLLTTAGLAVAVADLGQPAYAAAALAAGGLVAAVLRLRDGRPGWRILPPGSTPRLMAAIVVFAFGSVAVISTEADARWIVRLAAFAVAALAGGRVVTRDHRGLALGAASAVALGLGALGGATAIVAGALVAAVLGAIGGEEPAGVEG
jgi:hypothetical protein